MSFVVVTVITSTRYKEKCTVYVRIIINIYHHKSLTFTTKTKRCKNSQCNSAVLLAIHTKVGHTQASKTIFHS